MKFNYVQCIKYDVTEVIVFFPDEPSCHDNPMHDWVVHFFS